MTEQVSYAEHQKMPVTGRHDMGLCCPHLLTAVRQSSSLAQVTTHHCKIACSTCVHRNQTHIELPAVLIVSSAQQRSI